MKALPFAIGLVAVLSARPAHAQGSMTDVLDFLLTNRSIATDDFARDARAATETRAAISGLLANELGRLPITSGAGGFTYRMNPELGVMERSSGNFGPFYLERALTSGTHQAVFSVLYYDVTFDDIEGRSLRDGTLVSTASQLRGDSQPFDVETLSMRLRTSTVALLATYGLTDRLDVGVAVPFVTLTLDGQRIDVYRGQQSVQASAAASTSGLGDVVVRGKYNIVRGQTLGIAAGAEVRLPTGREEDLLGLGTAIVQPRVIVSAERARLGAHAVLGPVFGAASSELAYAAGLTLAASARVTIAGEVSGRRASGLGRLTATTEQHPTLAGVDTIRLTSVSQTAHEAIGVVGLKWNIAGTWLLNAHVQHALTSAGLNGGWVPGVSIDYSFGR